MATIIKSGLATRQEKRFGINHQYITHTLTPYNYRWYAIVRESHYLYIKKIIKTDNDRTKVEYRTYSWHWKDGRETVMDYPTLDWALDDLNTLYNGRQGTFPPEVEGPWMIVTIPNLKKEKEPWAYQFNGIGKDNDQ